MPDATDLTFEVDRAQLDRLLAGADDAIDRLVGEVAERLRDEAARESGPASRTVSDSWKTKPGAIVEDAAIVWSDAWFAAFLARGTRAHGPRKAKRMVWVEDGKTIRASYVRGIRPDPFHERAIETTEAAADDILDRLIAEVTA